jgi:hypothetical protein
MAPLSTLSHTILLLTIRIRAGMGEERKYFKGMTILKSGGEIVKIEQANFN